VEERKKLAGRLQSGIEVGTELRDPFVRSRFYVRERSATSGWDGPRTTEVLDSAVRLCVYTETPKNRAQRRASRVRRDTLEKSN